MDKWTDHPSYKEVWTLVKELPGGAQANSYVAERNGTTGFLKALKSNNDNERRARFYDEASAYFRYDHQRLPKLIESNAANFKNSAFKLYLVSELIEGPNLEAAIKQRGPFGLEESLAVAFGLVEVLEYLHSNGYVHRDVKPDNIILRDDAPEGVVLVDLGIGHDTSQAEKSHETEVGQELGNRFLRLPELRNGSSAKRDPRSDLAFAAGILLYCVTGVVPANLMDETGKMPHRRPEVLAELQKRVPKHTVFPLLNLFDKAFDHTIESRHATAADLRDALVQVRDATPQSTEPTANELEKMLEARLSSAKNENLARVRKSLETSIKMVTDIHSTVAASAFPVLAPSQTNYRSANTEISTSVGFAQSGDHQKSAYVKVSVQATGDEMLFRLNGENVYRTSLYQPTFDADFEEVVRKQFLTTALAVESL